MASSPYLFQVHEDRISNLEDQNTKQEKRLAVIDNKLEGIDKKIDCLQETSDSVNNRTKELQEDFHKRQAKKLKINNLIWGIVIAGSSILIKELVAFVIKAM